MKDYNRFTFKFLGVVMEEIQITPKEIRKTMWSGALILFIAIILFKSDSIITAIRWW